MHTQLGEEEAQEMIPLGINQLKVHGTTQVAKESLLTACQCLVPGLCINLLIYEIPN